MRSGRLLMPTQVPPIFIFLGEESLWRPGHKARDVKLFLSQQPVNWPIFFFFFLVFAMSRGTAPLMESKQGFKVMRTESSYTWTLRL